jgi:FkbM family methyltransferase
MRIPAPIARALEWRLQRAQGKGIGFNSVEDEVRTLGFFLDLLNLGDVIILDIGANKGQYGRQIKEMIPSAVLYSFEPSESAFRELEITASKYPDWITRKLGFGSQKEVVELFASEPGSASGSMLSQNDTFGRSLSLGREFVSIDTIDCYLSQEAQIKPNVLKLDVEGYEMRCLNGAKDSISQFKIVQFEFGEINVDARLFFKDFWNFFKSHEFDLYRITRRRPIKIDSYSEDLETFAVTNYLAVRV